MERKVDEEQAGNVGVAHCQLGNHKDSLWRPHRDVAGVARLPR